MVMYPDLHFFSGCEVFSYFTVYKTGLFFNSSHANILKITISTIWDIFATTGYLLTEMTVVVCYNLSWCNLAGYPNIEMI